MWKVIVASTTKSATGYSQKLVQTTDLGVFVTYLFYVCVGGDVAYMCIWIPHVYLVSVDARRGLWSS